MRAKKTCLTLAVSMFMGVTAQADEVSFNEALLGGKFSGDINTVIQYGSESDAGVSAGPMSDTKTANTALSLNYETANFNGFKFGVAVQAGYDWKLDDGQPWQVQGEDDQRNSIQSINLQNAYIDYAFDPEATKSTIRIGRQDIISPLVMRSSMYPMKDAFDAVVLTNKDISGTTLKLMYIENWRKRYGDSSNNSILEKDARFDGSVYSIYINNNSVKGLNIEGQYLSNDSDSTLAGDPPTNFFTSGPYDTTFLALNYTIPESKVVLGTMYVDADYDKGADTDLWGARIATKFGKLGVTLAYTSTDDANSLPGTLGHVPWFRAYALTELSPEIIAGVDETSVSLNYETGIAGLKTSLVYASWNQSAEGTANSRFNLDDASELAVDVKYKFPQVEGLSGRIQLSQLNYDIAGDSDLTFLRAHLKYAF